MELLESRQLLATVYPQYQSTNKVVYDAAGNRFETGLFSGTHDFGGSTLVARGDSDVYVAKYSSAGSLQWVQQFGGDYTQKPMRDYEKREYVVAPERLYAGVGTVGNQFPIQAGEYVTDLVLDSAGNAYITGGFIQTASIKKVSLTSGDKDYYDAFLIKIDSAGALASAQQFGGTFNDVGMSLAVDSYDNLYIGGYFSRTADLDPGRHVQNYTALGRDDGFIIRLTPAGKLAMVYQCGGEDARQDVRDSVNDIAVTGRGNIYFAGSASEKSVYSPGKDGVVLKPGRKTNAFVGQLNRKGTLTWVQSIGGDSYDANNNITLGNDGSVYTAGYFSEDIDVDPRANVENVFTAAGDQKQFTDVMICKYTPAGAPVWQKQITGDYFETVSDLQATTDGSIYLVGSFFRTIDVDPSAAVVNLNSAKTDSAFKDANTDFKRNDSYDWYVAHLSSAGAYINSARFGTADDDFAISASFNSAGRLVVAGVQTVATGERKYRHESNVFVTFSEDLTTVTQS